MKFKLATAAAAVIMTASAAQAADLAKKAPAAVDYVKVCDTYGTGFFYIPGTDTCLKISGYTRFQTSAGNSDIPGDYDYNRAANTIKSRARFLLDVDARTSTEYGLLKGFAETYFTVDQGSSSPSTSVDFAYIQFVGFTAGRAVSFFDAAYQGYALNAAGYSMYGSDGIKTNLLAYTFGFGNGVSASISLEDPTTNGRRVSGSLFLSGATATTQDLAFDDYGGLKVPDVVANLVISQAWGSAQLSAVYHDIYVSTASLAGGAAGSADDDSGWAVMAGLEINLPMLGAGDKIGITAAYGDGAVGYAAPYVGKAGYYVADATNGDTNEAWSVSAGFRHFFSSKWRGDVQASYASFQAGSGLATNADVDIWGVSGSVTWTPVTNLAITLGVDYLNASGGLTSGTSTAPLATAEDRDAFAVALRVQRSF